MSEQAAPKIENKMGVMPVPKLLITMSLPMIISMTVQALYNIVDSLFVAKVSEAAFNGLSLAFPVQMFLIAFGAGTGVGMNAYLSKCLGEGKHKEASKTAVNGIFLGLCTYVVFAIFGIFFARGFFEVQTDNIAIIEAGSTYVSICTIMSFGIFMQMTMERLLQSTGKTVYSMITQLSGAVINLILDPILIFGYFGMPKMGVTGAAIATVSGQIVAMCLAIYFNIAKNKEISLSFKGFRPNGKIIGRIYSVGVPAIIMQAIGSIMVLFMNKLFLSFTETDRVAAEGAVFVFGAYFKLNSIFFMPVFGLNNGMIPILAFNYGARKPKRIMTTIKLSILLALCFMVVGTLIFQFVPDKILGLFDASEQIIQMGVPAFRIISTSFLFAAFCIILLSVFQAFGSGVLSLIVSATRQLAVLVPVAYLIANLFGLEHVWWCYPIAEIFSVALCGLFFRYLYRKKIAPLKDSVSS